MLWADIQEAFYIIFAPFVVGVILPLFVAAGVLVAVLMVAQRFWRPLQRIIVVFWAGRIDTD